MGGFMAQQSQSFGLVMLMFGAIIGFGGYPIFLMQRKRVGALFGLAAGFWILANIKTKLDFEQSGLVLVVSAIVGGALFFSSVTLMNHGVALVLGAALSHQIYAMMFKQFPSPAIPGIVGFLGALAATMIGIPFLMGLLAFTGSLLMVVGFEALVLPHLMVNSAITVVAFNITPVQNILIILVCLALSVFCYVAQYYLLRSLLEGRI
jgi:hypothetical protein